MAGKETGVTEAAAVDQEFRLLDLDLIEESSTNPRKTFDAKQLEDLTASVKEKGVIVPILVRPVGATFEVVAGARRFRAAKKAGLNQIPAIIRNLADDQALEAQVIENLQRADVHPLEEAEGYQALIDKHKYDVDTIAAKVGKSVSYVYQRLKLCELIPSAKAAFLGGRITAGHAVLIARLQPADQADALKICNAESSEYVRTVDAHVRMHVGVRALADWIKNSVHMSLDGAPWQKDDADLLPKAGPCTTCPKRAGNAPELFNDVARPQTCTDPTCFNDKLKAHVARLAKELEAQGKKVVKISQYHTDQKGVLTPSDYHNAAGKKRCDNTVVGFFVDGEKRGKTTDVCTAVECKVHRPTYSSYSSSSSSGEDHKERERRIIKERATERARLEIFKQVIKKTKSLGRKELEILALNGHFGLPYALDTNGGWIKDLDERDLAKASDEDLAKFLLGIAIGHQQLGAHQDADVLYRAAALRKLDVKAIEKAALRQVAHERLHHAKRLRWKGSAKAGKKSFDELTCTGCGRMQKEQAKGGWHWAQLPPRSKDHTNAALCNDCEREENERE
jgi:ParB family transcriptional regulator, chromosome partitioning protein